MMDEGTEAPRSSSWVLVLIAMLLACNLLALVLDVCL